MKKLLLLAVSAICFASCESGTKVNDYRDKDNLPVQIITHFEYKGHEYIFFDTDARQWAVGGVVHDPDCKCKVKRKQDENIPQL